MPSGNETTTKFKVDISDLKKNIQEANRQIRLANAEFKTASAGMDSWSKSADGLSAKIAQTDKVLKAQKTILADYEKQLELISAEYGENSKEADEMRIKVENQRATVIKTEKSIGDFQSKLADLEAEQKKSAEAAKLQETGLAKLEKTISDQESALKELKTQYKNVVLEQGDSSDSAKALASQIDKLSSELNDNKTRLSEVDKAADDLDKTLDEVSESASDAANGGFTVLKGAIANLVADGVRAALNGLKKLGSEIVDVGKKSIANYAEYEQLVGGVETLFKDSANQVQKYANKAFKTAGLSANDYMETVTSFSASLLQGLNGDTAKAAKTADLAITDMSDNANKMGTSMESIQNAYQGFAKQNYTMLDNLKLGYGGTQKEMARLINDSGVLGDTMKVTEKNVNEVSFDKIIEAIHVVQNEMGITGTTAKEAAETIEGSKNAMQAAWQNLLTGLADDDADIGALFDTFMKSAETYLNNILPRIETLVGRAVDFVKEKLQEKFPDAMKVVETVFGTIKSAFSWVIDNSDYIISALAGIGAAIVAWNIASVVTNIIKMVNAIKAMGAASAFAAAKQWLLNTALMANPIGLVVAAIAGLVTAFVVLWYKSEKFRNFWIGLWEKIKGVAEPIITSLSEWFSEAWDKIKKVLAPVAKIIGGYFKMAWKNIQVVWDVAVKYFKMIWDNIKLVFSVVKSVLSGDFSGAWDAIKQIFGNTGKFFGEVWDGIKSIFGNVGEFFGNAFSGVKDKITGAFSKVGDWFKSNWKSIILFILNPFAGLFKYLYDNFEGFRNFVDGVWEKIKTGVSNMAQAVIEFFQPVIDFFTAAWNIIKELAVGCWNLIKAVWSVVSEWFKTNVIQPVVTFFTALWDAIKTAASAAWTFIKSVWAAVSGWFTAHVIQPVAKFFAMMWNGIKTAASTAWNGIKAVWSVVSSWFNNTIIQPVAKFFTGMWDGLKKGAADAWDGIKKVFSVVSDWFKDTFSVAWQKVKDVFSTGGKVFDGIKEGIVSAFTTVVNAIIRGINKVIAIPFNAINDILDNIQNVSIAGIEPFSGLVHRLPVPQIPELARGGVLKRGQVGLLEGNGAEAVVPLENNKRWIAATAAELKRALASEGIIGGGAGAAPAVTNNYNFTQNNNSPKALSRLEIYRQSKNLLHLKGAT